jgi:hypothetical protein
MPPWRSCRRLIAPPARSLYETACDLFESHKYGYDLETLTKVLGEAGFVERSTHMGSPHEALRVDEFSAVASAKYGERHYSLFVEARKPG